MSSTTTTDEIKNSEENVQAKAPQISSPPQRKTPLISEGVSSEWKKSYQLLLDFYKATGHAEVPDDGSYLSKWVQEQNKGYTALVAVLEGRNCRVKKALNEEQVRLLRKAGFIFRRVDVHNSEKEKVWEEKIALLLKYRNKYGNCDVPTKDVEDADEQFRGLGTWLSSIRRKARDASSNSSTGSADPFMTTERIQRLVDIGVNFAPRRGVALKRKAESPLPNDRKQPPPRSSDEQPNTKPKFNEKKWETMFQEMKKFRETHGHTNIPCRSPANQALRGFLTSQRAEYRKLQASEPSRLTVDKVQRLNDIGFVWTSKKSLTFDERFQQWVNYKAENNGKDPSRFSEDGLGKWIQSTRAKYKEKQRGKKNNLTEEQIDRLNEHGFVWAALRSPKDRSPVLSWEERLAELRLFRKEHGHTAVPQHQAGLGSWVASQRRDYQKFLKGKKTTITPDRIAKLNAVGFTWDARSRRFGRSPSTSNQSPSLSQSVSSSSSSDEEAL